MKIVALVSGGKDSCYNMMQCVANGHEITALANLKPSVQSGKDELDSFMYQTVGHDAIHLYAECMDVPLYRREILGGSVLQSSDYTTTPDDETEDLLLLLKEVLVHYPDVQGVSVGAILSNYQRVRVEHVCNRLGLMSFAYLWRRDQKELLYEMANAGVNAILIKVAALGLKPIHLGKSIGQMYPLLCQMSEMYGVHICGEGGEYETFTVDCPLFKKRIVIDETETIIHSDDAFAPVAYTRFKKYSVVPKSPEEMDMTHVVVQSWKDWERYQELISAIEGAQNTTIAKPGIFSCSEEISSENKVHVKTNDLSPFFAISGTTAYDNDASIEFESIEKEVFTCMKLVEEKLAKYNLGWKDAVSVNVFVSDMEDFGRINAVYKTFFDINPSPRALVGARLKGKARLQIDITAIKLDENIKRETMHVQGVSYWAPANIGPYSQSVVTQGHAFIAGQIALEPNALTIPSPPSFSDEAALSLRNLENITSVLSLPLCTTATLCTCFVSDPTYLPLAKVAWETYTNGDTPPTAYIAITSLPKNAMVEWQVVLDAPLATPFGQEEYDNTTDEELDQETLNKLAALKVREDPFDVLSNGVKARALVKSNVTAIVIEAEEASNVEEMIKCVVEAADKALRECKKKWDRVLSLRVFYNDTLNINGNTLVVLLQGQILERSKAVPVLTSIPSTALGCNGDGLITCTLHIV